MAAPYVELNPEAALVLKQRQAIHLRGQTKRLVGAPVWHIIDAERAHTWCGLFHSKGVGPAPFSETPEEHRCHTCIAQLGREVVQDP